MNRFRELYTQGLLLRMGRDPCIPKYCSTDETRRQTGKWRQRMLNPVWMKVQEALANEAK